MTAQDDADGFVLSTGRWVYAHAQIIGINATATQISGGYDQRLHEAVAFTAAEKAEMAQYMIARWARWGGL